MLLIERNPKNGKKSLFKWNGCGFVAAHLPVGQGLGLVGLVHQLGRYEGNHLVAETLLVAGPGEGLAEGGPEVIRIMVAQGFEPFDCGLKGNPPLDQLVGNHLPPRSADNQD
jgi:hypothetical protein